MCCLDFKKSFTRKGGERNVENENIKIEVFEDKCLLHEVHIFDFFAVPSYITVIWFNSSEPIYFIKVVKKGTSKKTKR